MRCIDYGMIAPAGHRPGRLSADRRADGRRLLRLGRRGHGGSQHPRPLFRRGLPAWCPASRWRPSHLWQACPGATWCSPPSRWRSAGSAWTGMARCRCWWRPRAARGMFEARRAGLYLPGGRVPQPFEEGVPRLFLKLGRLIGDAEEAGVARWPGANSIAGDIAARTWCNDLQADGQQALSRGDLERRIRRASSIRSRSPIAMRGVYRALGIDGGPNTEARARRMDGRSCRRSPRGAKPDGAHYARLCRRASIRAYRHRLANMGARRAVRRGQSCTSHFCVVDKRRQRRRLDPDPAVALRLLHACRHRPAS